MLRALSSLLLILVLVFVIDPVPVDSQTWDTPLCAIKGRTNGYFYVPDLNVSTIKIELWCNDSNPSRMEGDQKGGTSPYSNIDEWVDGKVDILDAGFINSHYGEYEGDPNWNYMADVEPDRKIDVVDAGLPSKNYGQMDGSYTNDLTYVYVIWNTGQNTTPNANGFISIPSGATSFTVYNGSNTIMALVTFWEEELISKTWHDISFWQFNLEIREWVTVRIWFLNVSTRTWNNINYWIFKMAIKTWQDIEKWVFEFKVKLLNPTIPVPIILFTAIFIIGVSLWILEKNRI